MARLSEMEMDRWMILLYGPVGRGKTALALTLGKDAQVVDLDDGLRTGLTLRDEFYDSRRSVDVVQCLEKSASTATAFTLAKRHITSVVDQCNKGKYPFKYLVLDSYTAMAEAAVRKVLSDNNKLGQAIEIQHWGMAFSEIKHILLMLRVLPITVVMIAHEQARVVDKMPMVEIATPGQKMPMEVPRYFDEVWRMKIANKPGGKLGYVIQTKGTPCVTARSRSNLADGTDANLGMPKILTLLKEGKRE